MNIVFMGTPHFAVPALEALIGSSHRVVAVYSQPPRPAGRGMKLTPSPVQQVAEREGISVFTPETLKTEQARAQFAAHRADIAVVAAYGLLLPKQILTLPKLGCINIHPSDLPRWRGAAPIQRTLMAGDTKTACCIMQMEEGLDTGPVIVREVFNIPPTMNAGELHHHMAEGGARLLLQALHQLENGTAKPVPQSSEGVTYASKIGKADQPLDWKRPAQELLNQLRGLSPAPGVVVSFHGEVIKLFAAEVEVGDATKAPGEALDNRLLINAGNGTALRLTELQRAGKSRQPANQILLGFHVPAGTRAEILAHNL